jgi:MarR family transcriptional regulator, lower aerobic nicotinate degradation pathway regulator
VIVETMNDLYHKRLAEQVKVRVTVLHSDRPPEELAGYTGFLLGYLGEKSRRRFIAMLEPHGFHPREFGLMTVLSKRPGITQQELAGLARVDPSSMVAILDDLEKRGIAERRVDAEDRRRRSVFLTEEGERNVRMLQGEARKAAKEFLAPLEPAERADLNALLRKLAGLDEA